MSKHQYAFGRLENRRDKVRSVIVPRRLKGLLGALAGAVLLAIFAAMTFALMDRGSAPSPKPAERSAAATERPAARVIGTSSRPKTDLRQSQAAVLPRAQQIDPAPAAPVEPRAAQTEAPLPSPTSSPVPASSPVMDRYPGPAPASEPQRTIEPREDVTATVIERPEKPSEYKPAEDAGWPVVPQQAARSLSSDGKSEAPTDCLPEALRGVIRDLEARFGPVTIVSTTHLKTDNHSPGSIRDKLHQACKAVDIRATRDPKEVIAFLKSRPEVGGINTYRNRLVHFDLNANYKAAGNERAEAAGSGRPVRR